MKETVLWGIHGGAYWEADDLCRKKDVIAIGWEIIGDLSKHKDREVYKERYKKVYPGSSEGAIRNTAGIFYRFVYEMQPGDLVIYPSSPSKQVFIGKVIGPYEYRPDVDKHFPNQRQVKWLRKLPRTSFSQDALYEIGSALTLFQVKNYADEFITALKGVVEPPSADEEEAAIITKGMESQTRDFILKQLRKHPNRSE